jgi:hypothetical protein
MVSSAGRARLLAMRDRTALVGSLYRGAEVFDKTRPLELAATIILSDEGFNVCIRSNELTKMGNTRYIPRSLAHHTCD